jgi:glycerol-3-phosphate dehydrogenase
VASAFGSPTEELLPPLLAFNLLFDRDPPSEVALAVSGPDKGAHTWFLYARDGKPCAGTAYFPWEGPPGRPAPSTEQIDAVIADINAAIPDLDLQRRQVVHVEAGLLPATHPGSAQPGRRPVIHDHGRRSGPAGLISVSGVKYTTARDIAERALRLACSDQLREIDPGATRPTAAELTRRR